MPNPFQPGQTLQGLRYCFIHHVDIVIAAAQLPTLRRNDVQGSHLVNDTLIDISRSHDPQQ